MELKEQTAHVEKPSKPPLSESASLVERKPEEEAIGQLGGVLGLFLGSCSVE